MTLLIEALTRYQELADAYCETLGLEPVALGLSASQEELVRVYEEHIFIGTFPWSTANDEQRDRALARAIVDRSVQLAERRSRELLNGRTGERLS